MNRTRLNLLLLAVVTGLVLAVAWERRQAEDVTVPLLPFGENDVASIALRHPGKPAIELRRIDGSFQLTAPFEAPAEAVEVAGILNLTSLDSERQLAVTDVSLAELELDPPNYEVQINDTVLQVGGVEPIEFRRYLRIGDTVHLVPDPPSAALDADPSDLVAKRLIPADRTIVQIELPELTLAAADPGWTLLPDDPEASADQKQQLVDAWQNARAMWHKLPDDFGATKPDIRITLDDGSTVTATIVKRDPQLVLGRPDLGIHQHLSRALVDTLLRLPDPPAEDEARDESLDVDAVVGNAVPDGD